MMRYQQKSDCSLNGYSDGPSGGLRGYALRSLRRFRKDEDGSLLIFALFIFVLMVMMGGMAVDLMRFETTRTKLQNTLDRAILAAADLDQTLDPASVVADYFEVAGMTAFLGPVTVDESLNHRTVSATASVQVDTLFMQMMNIDYLTAPAGGTAEERVGNVEVSLVLDISGSMRRDNKMALLRDAAAEFVDTIIQDDAPDLISVSLIPYTAHVNAGPDLYAALNTMDEHPTAPLPAHDYSWCVEFTEADFEMTGLELGMDAFGNPERYYQQSQHFENSGSSSHPIRNPGCPMRDYERIIPFSQDVVELQGAIAQMTPRANTAIHLGMKWATVLLDPSTNDIVQELVDNGVVDATFDNRPAAWTGTQTLKFIVLMTDGQNVSTYRIHPQYYWNVTYNDPYYGNMTGFENFDVRSLRNFTSYGDSPLYDSYYYYRLYSSSQADAMLDNVCDAARDAGIRVFTIGFEVGDHGADVMRSCATDPADFFRVEGLEISDAFAAIAREISQLRLVQ